MKVYQSPFHAIEQNDETAANLVLRANLIGFIADCIERLEWKQAEVAEAFAISQPRVSQLLTGQVDKFSLDALFNFIALLGFKPDFNRNQGDDQPPAIGFIRVA